MKNFISIIITFVIGFILYYFMLPAFNLHSIDFWIFLILVLFTYFIVNLFFNVESIDFKNYKFFSGYKYLGIIVIICFVVIGSINFVLSPLFNSKSYRNRIFVDSSTEFVSEVPLVDFNSLPLLDKDSSQKLGDRVMGQMPELVSQFYVSDIYTQINYNGSVVRVTPLEYDGIIKYFSNRKDGIKGYISVDSVNGEVHLVKLDKGLRYMPSSMFNENLYRKLRFSYPTKIFGDVSFEIDDEGIPYFIVPVISISYFFP